MGRARKFLCALLAAALLTGCAPGGGETTGPKSTEPVRHGLEERLADYAQLGQSPDDNYRTWYEIFVGSFCDADGDGIGDLQGAISKLDYLQELGVNGIWLMPIHPSTTYHKYNVDDYYAIDPSYGTMEDFDALMEACRERDIHVILDLVVNHSGYENPWFQEAADYLKALPDDQTPDPAACPYVEYYHFRKEGQSMTGAYRRLAGTDYYYEAQFDPNMPDLNWDSQAMRQSVAEVMAFWLDKGVAGFRVDAAKEFYTGNISGNVEVLSWLQDTAESLKSDVYMVAEVWESNYAIIQEYYESGFTSIFNYPYGNGAGNTAGVLLRTVNGRGNANVVGKWATAVATTDAAYAQANPDYIDAAFLTNHDVLRISNSVGGDPARIKLAGALNLFMGGSAFIYYGEEIGMNMGTTVDDPSKRAPMCWSGGWVEGMTNIPPGCTLPSGYPLGGVEEQRADEYSVLNYYREAIAIRNALPMIARGDNTVESALDQGCVSALRKDWNGQECIILTNVQEEAAQVDLSAYDQWDLVASLTVDEGMVTMEGQTLTMPPFAIAILIPHS